MSIVLFKEITTEETLIELEVEGKKYVGLYVDMDDKKQRKYVKDSAALINGLLKKVERARIDKSKEFKLNVESEAKEITERLNNANSPFSLLIDEHNEKRKLILENEKRIADEKALEIQIAIDYEVAELMMADYFRKLAEEKEQARLDQIAHDEKIALEAKQEAEKEAADKIAKAEQDKQDAIIAAKAAEDKSEQDVIDADNRAKQTKINADYHAEAVAVKAEIDKKIAVNDEKQRQINEQARIDREAKSREADVDNKKAVNNEAVTYLVIQGLDKASAKKAVIAIAKGFIPNVKISY